MEEPELIYSIVRKLHEGLDVPVTVKIRRFDELAKTIAYAKGLEAAGAQVCACF